MCTQLSATAWRAAKSLLPPSQYREAHKTERKVSPDRTAPSTYLTITPSSYVTLNDCHERSSTSFPAFLYRYLQTSPNSNRRISLTKNHRWPRIRHSLGLSFSHTGGTRSPTQYYFSRRLLFRARQRDLRVKKLLSVTIVGKSWPEPESQFLVMKQKASRLKSGPFAFRHRPPIRRWRPHKGRPEARTSGHGITAPPWNIFAPVRAR